MGFRFPGIVNAKESLNHSASSKTLEIPRGHFAVYVGKNQKKRFVIPVSYFNEPLFLDLLNQTEEEFGYVHPMGGITIPCSEDSFVHLTSCLSVIVNTIEGNLGSNFISKASSFWNVKMMTRL